MYAQSLRRNERDERNRSYIFRSELVPQRKGAKVRASEDGDFGKKNKQATKNNTKLLDNSVLGESILLQEALTPALSLHSDR